MSTTVMPNDIDLRNNTDESGLGLVETIPVLRAANSRSGHCVAYFKAAYLDWTELCYVQLNGRMIAKTNPEIQTAHWESYPNFYNDNAGHLNNLTVK